MSDCTIRDATDLEVQQGIYIKKLAAELAEFTRAEPLKVAERNEWRERATKAEAELAEVRDALKAVWPLPFLRAEDTGRYYNGKQYQAAIDKVKAQVNK